MNNPDLIFEVQCRFHDQEEREMFTIRFMELFNKFRTEIKNRNKDNELEIEVIKK